MTGSKYVMVLTAKGLIMWPIIDKQDQNIYPKGQTILRFIGIFY